MKKAVNALCCLFSVHATHFLSVYHKYHDMKRDSSWLLHDKYYSLTNKTIEVILRNGRSIKGVFVGFFVSDEESGPPSILRWHIADLPEGLVRGVDGLGNMKGEIIRHRVIAEIRFAEDQSVMKF